MEIEELKGVGEKTSEKLKEAGIDTIEKLKGIDINELIELTNLSENKATGIIESIKLFDEPFNLENELKKEKKYLQNGFKVFITNKGYDVNTKEKYDNYMKEYKEA